MSDAPEQIYAWPSYGENSAAGVWGVTRYPEYAVEYVRADLYEALQARVAELEAERADCDKYLKPDETPRQRMDRDHADVLLELANRKYPGSHGGLVNARLQ
ncbi:hypothetical protein [Hoeflea sp.]|uniref:hypothetical protein n=1 Tax=Hoeflea sp. TaxID=1940281 RepID=UPI0019CE64ED|nr:hypothetical protein [Hoeflea sp.]MBC7282631.1 hypothetical protein [Hoeflea sp.]